MTQSTELLAALKRAANYSKLAMHNEGPRSYKRGQGALMKVTYKFGNAKKGISLKKLCEVLGWGRRETLEVAKKAAKNGYVTVERKASGKRRVKLTELGDEILQKRFAAEDRAADEVFGYLTDAEREQFLALCNKVSDACEEMGIDYAEIQEKKGGRKHAHRHEHVHRIVKRGKDAAKAAKAAKAEKTAKEEVPVAAAVEDAGAAETPTAEAPKAHHGFHGFHIGRGHDSESSREAALETQVTPMSPAPKPATTPTSVKPEMGGAQNL